MRGMIIRDRSGRNDKLKQTFLEVEEDRHLATLIRYVATKRSTVS